MRRHASLEGQDMTKANPPPTAQARARAVRAKSVFNRSCRNISTSHSSLNRPAKARLDPDQSTLVSASDPLRTSVPVSKLPGPVAVACNDGRFELEPMVLAGDNSGCRLTILGYQFPDDTTDEYDSNWLVIGGEVWLDGREWQFRDPCLTTFEAKRLADWLEL
jgi:hypothetical protein